MTTQKEGRFYTYYESSGPEGYTTSCFFCTNVIGVNDARWYSAKPTPIYACTRCFEDNKVRPPNQEALPQDRESRIAEAHRENMESAKATRNCIVLLNTTVAELVKAVHDNANVHAQRTEILRQQLKGET